MSLFVREACGWSHFRDRGTKAQGYLGINFRDVPEDQISVLKLKDDHGEEVVLVDHDGPACASGMKEHDVLLQLNGQPIDNEDQLRHSLREIPAGKRVSFLISREGQQQTLTIELANRDTVGQQAWDRHMTVPEPASHTIGLFGTNAPTTADLPKRNLLGATILSSSYTGALLELMGPQLADFFGTQTGLLVRSVDPDSPAAVSGLRAGDVITKVNAVPLTNSADWLRAVHDSKGKPLAVVVLRDKKEQILTLIPDAKKRSRVTMPDRDMAPATTVGILIPPSPLE